MASVRTLGLGVCALFLAGGAPPAKQKPDLADLAQGSYAGDVISDARGSSQSDVEIIVTRTGPNMVSVKADYQRIPPRTFKLNKALDTIQNVGGTEVFLLDLSKSPQRLDLTIDDASWSGQREAAGRP